MKAGKKMVLYFSGTGNSRKIAEVMAEDLKGEVISINERIKNNNNAEILSEEPLIFVTPVYAGRLPRVAENYIRRTKFSGKREAYFIVTCFQTPHNEEKYIKKLCSETGLKFMGFESIHMPQNYIVMYTPPKKKEAEATVKLGIEKAHSISKAIQTRGVVENKNHTINASEKMMSSVINSIMYATMVKAKAFYATDACTGCGICEKNCPLNNISLVNKKPKWGSDCTHCMACICGCPSQAIEYGKKTQGKPRYYL